MVEIDTDALVGVALVLVTGFLCCFMLHKLETILDAIPDEVEQKEES